MERVLARNLKENIDKQVTVEGWLHKKRKLGGLNFINVRDRSGLTQALIEDKNEVEKLRGMQVGTVLRVTGNVISDDRAPGGAEIHEPTLEIIIPVEAEPPIEIDKPLRHDSELLDTLFENRALGLRNINEQTIFKVRSNMLRLIREFFYENDFTEIQTPKLLAGATEGGAEVFKLDYFGKEATLAQSPQFYKQMMVGVFERVFEIGQAYRAELSATTRHMTELTMLDMEMGFIESHNDVLNMTQNLVYSVLTKLYKENADDLKLVKAPELVIKSEFPRFTVAEIHDLYSDATGEDTRNEKDLIPAEERWICEYAKEKHGCEAVFATDFPKEAAKFYHMIDEENGTVKWGDLLFRGVEIATVPQREHRYEKLVEQIKAAGIDPEHPGFKYYLSAFRFGLPAHGGFGFGLDRFLQLITGLNNVKEATLFPRDLNRLSP